MTKHQSLTQDRSPLREMTPIHIKYVAHSRLLYRPQQDRINMRIHHESGGIIKRGER